MASGCAHVARDQIKEDMGSYLTSQAVMTHQQAQGHATGRFVSHVRVIQLRLIE